MTPTGKISEADFDSIIASRLGADRDDVELGPTYGVDFGIVSMGDYRLISSTDPLSILPELGWKRAGTFAISFVLADIAVSGVTPTHLTVSFALPTSIQDSEFSTLWSGIHEECESLGISIVTGHTARYSESRFPWVGSATALAITEHDQIIRPDGASPGDVVLITRGPAIETTGLLTTVFPDAIPVDEETLATGQQLLDQTTIVRDAIDAASAGNITAMHDVTEGGIYGALHEVATASDVGLEITRSAIPFHSVVETISDVLDFDPWRATSAGSLIICTAPTDADLVVSTLQKSGIPVSKVGRVTENTRVVIDGEPIPREPGDSSWSVYERLLGMKE